MMELNGGGLITSKRSRSGRAAKSKILPRSRPRSENWSMRASPFTPR
jgi:hypothetical protein